MSIYVPTINTAYMQEKMLENQTLAALLASGVVDMQTLGVTVKGGDYVDVPTIAKVADFARIDISSAAALSFTAASSNDDKAVVLRDASANSYKKHDVIRSGENFGALLGGSVGDRLAKRLCQQMFRVTGAALDSVDSPSANCHVKDLGNAAITVNGVRQAAQLLGDEMASLTTMVIHSGVWGDLLYDMYTNYKVDAIAGTVILNGRLASVLGIRNVIVTDLVPTANTGTGSTGDDRYDTFLFAPGALWAAYQRQPEQEVFADITTPSTLVKIKIGMDYCAHLRGLKWGGSANPSDTDVATAGNYSQVFTGSEGHKQIGAIKIKSNANKY